MKALVVVATILVIQVGVVGVVIYAVIHFLCKFW